MMILIYHPYSSKYGNKEHQKKTTTKQQPHLIWLILSDQCSMVEVVLLNAFVLFFVLCEALICFSHFQDNAVLKYTSKCTVSLPRMSDVM